MISASHGTHQMAIFPHGEIWAVNLVCLGSWCTSKIHYSNLFYSNPPFGRPGLSQPSAQLGARESHPRKASRSMRSSESGRSMLSKDLQLAKAPGWMGMGLEVGGWCWDGDGVGDGGWGMGLEVGGWGLGVGMGMGMANEAFKCLKVFPIPEGCWGHALVPLPPPPPSPSPLFFSKASPGLPRPYLKLVDSL